MESGIYIIRNIINNKVYIGKSVLIKSRIYNHKSALRGSRHRNKYLQRAYDKYGMDNFIFEVLEKCPEEQLSIDYSNEGDLADAIDRYFTLLRITFDLTGIYKIFETGNSQIYQSISQANIPPIPLPKQGKAKVAHADFVCPKCQIKYKIQLNLESNVKLVGGATMYPKSDNFTCPNCRTITNLTSLKLQVEAQTGSKVIL